MYTSLLFILHAINQRYYVIPYFIINAISTKTASMNLRIEKNECFISIIFSSFDVILLLFYIHRKYVGI